MALIKCPDCGKETSTLAKSCPNCGRPMETPKACLPYDDKSRAFCPICTSTILVPAIFPDEYRVVNNGTEEKGEYFCSYCGSWVEPLCPKYEYRYYLDIAKERYGNSYNYVNTVMVDEIKQNPLFDEDKYKEAQIEDKRIKEIIREKNKANENKTKCPHCGSTNIAKISTLNRAVSVGVFGLASSKIGKQYECKACKHKW